MYPILAIVLLSVPLLDAKDDGHCVMRGECDVDTRVFVKKPCVYTGPPQPLKLVKSVKTLNDLCPDIKSESVCCDDAQVETFVEYFSILGSLFQRCPSCYYNLANVFCQMACSPSQSKFLGVTNFTGTGQNKTVNSIYYNITEDYAQGLFDSCKNVTVANTQYRAMEVFCGRGGDLTEDCTPHKWLGYIGGHDPSPIDINFRYVKKYGMNETIIPCDKPVFPSFYSVPCSYIDCPSTPIN